MTSDLQLKNPQIDMNIDRDKASTLGITAQQVQDALGYAYGQLQISTIYEPKIPIAPLSKYNRTFSSIPTPSRCCMSALLPGNWCR